MKEFKTLGPTQFGIGDGVKTRFSVARPGDIVRDSNIESVRRVGWQGDQLLHPYPRTNLAIASNDFTNSAWQGSPSLYMDFLSGTMPSSVDFSRASTATYVSRDRLIHTAAINEPRFTYDPATGKSLGLLVEGQGTNLVRSSFYGDGALWGHSASTGVIQDYGISNFEGIPTAYMHSVDGTSSNVYVYAGTSSGSMWYVEGTQYTASVFLRRNQTTDRNIRLVLHGNSYGTSREVRFNPVTGVVASSGNPEGFGHEDYGNGVVRIWVSHTAETTGSGWPPLIWIIGTPPIEEGVEFWGAQLEEGTRPTSYIPTEGSQVTRIDDTPTIPVGDWFNPSKGTFVVDFVAPEPTNFNTIIGMGSANGEEFRVGYGNSDITNFRITTRVGGGQENTAALLLSPGQRYRAAATYADSGAGVDYALWVDGSLVGARETERLPNGFAENGVAIGRRRPNADALNWNGTVERLAYYPRALSNAELQALTS